MAFSMPPITPFCMNSGMALFAQGNQIILLFDMEMLGNLVSCPNYTKDLYRPSSGFLASSGIFQLRPPRITPEIFPSAHRIQTLLYEISHFSAACFTDIYISISPCLDNNIFHFRNNNNAIGIIFSVYRNNVKSRQAAHILSFLAAYESYSYHIRISPYMLFFDFAGSPAFSHFRGPCVFWHMSAVFSENQSIFVFSMTHSVSAATDD